MKITKCKGAKDLRAEEMARFRYIEDIFRSCCSSCGYSEIRSPTLEYLHLFTSAGTLTPDMLSRVYSFLDWDGWSGERVVLRPDGTIPSARLYVENIEDSPLARLYYVENMFSFEGTDEQTRERWQCGAELMGGTEPEGDAELIMMALEVLNKLNIAPIDLELSHMGLLKTLSRELGLEKGEWVQRLTEIFGDDTTLNKIEKPVEIKSFLKMLSDLQGKSAGFVENLKSILPESLSSIRPVLDNMVQIAKLLDDIGQEYRIDFAPDESFEYYTGMVFRLHASGEMVGHGGRYDELIRLVGERDVPASGFAFSMDKIMPLISEPAAPQRILLTKRPDQIGVMMHLFDVASRLRQQGYVVETNSGPGDSCRWTVYLQQEESGISAVLTDQANGMVRKGLTIDELLEYLGEAQ